MPEPEAKDAERVGPMQVKRYPIPSTCDFSLDLPSNRSIVRVGMADNDSNQPYLWATVDPASVAKRHDFFVVKSGEDYFPGNCVYLGMFTVATHPMPRQQMAVQVEMVGVAAPPKVMQEYHVFLGERAKPDEPK